MAKDKTYKCKECGKNLKTSGNKTPECCGKPMTQLPLNICLRPEHAEHARPMDDEEPRDDGRAG